MSRSITVHQMLHGYSDGHRLIGGSLRLDSQAARAMLVMTDLSGPGVKPPSRGYLTGYPLEDAGKYVLARTWAAPEMPRPGCVWTHSLLIDYADLALLVEARSLLSLFQRPDEDIGAKYAHALNARLDDVPPVIVLSDRARGIVNSLYISASAQILAEAGDCEDDEEVALAVWMQQWPRLRRAFGFCTLAAVDRTGKGVYLDLQFARLSPRSVESTFPNAQFAGAAALIHPSLLPLERDLAAPRDSDFRDFLRRAGGDVQGHRTAMLPLCDLYTSLFNSRPPNLSGAVTALSALDGPIGHQARTVRSVVVKQALSQPLDADGPVFSFLLDMFEHAVDGDSRSLIGSKLSHTLWVNSRPEFWKVIGGNGSLRPFAVETLLGVDLNSILAGLDDQPCAVGCVVKLRPGLLSFAQVWKTPQADEEWLTLVSAELLPAVGAAMLAANWPAPPLYLLAQVQPEALGRMLSSENANRGTLRGWLEHVARNEELMAAVLAAGGVTEAATLAVLASFSGPDRVPNSYGEDPWAIALRSAYPKPGSPEQRYLAAHLLCRALGDQSRSVPDLLTFAYSPAYRALERGLFSVSEQAIATLRLDRGRWLEWDNCSRLRSTVVRKFVDGNFDPIKLLKISSDRDLVDGLIVDAWESHSGRSYLNRFIDAQAHTAGGDNLVLVDSIRKLAKAKKK